MPSSKFYCFPELFATLTRHFFQMILLCLSKCMHNLVRQWSVFLPRSRASYFPCFLIGSVSFLDFALKPPYKLQFGLRKVHGISKMFEFKISPTTTGETLERLDYIMQTTVNVILSYPHASIILDTSADCNRIVPLPYTPVCLALCIWIW